MWHPLFLAACVAPVPNGSGNLPPATGDTGVSLHTSTSVSDPDRLALLSLNLHCLKLDGTSFADHDARWAAIAEAVADREVQVLALQEVCVRSDLDALVALQSALEATTAGAWEGAFALAHVAWEGTVDEADEGVALLSRAGLSDPTELGYVDPGELRRVGLFATLDDGTTVATVHLDYGSAAAREDQGRQTASQLLAAAASLDLVVAGDLNDRAGSPTYDAFGSMGFIDASSEAGAPIDHAFAHRGARWQPERSEIWFEGDAAVSDHPGVFVELVASEPGPVELTRIVAHVDVGFGHTLSVRGGTDPLSWDRGWWAWPVSGDRWELVLTEVDGEFPFKTLLDDVTWQAGDDALGSVGVDNELTPTF
jgi:endonuclease/exonuclease/phosphatase family metal-dependent hydrolase